MIKTLSVPHDWLARPKFKLKRQESIIYKNDNTVLDTVLAIAYLLQILHTVHSSFHIVPGKAHRNS